jgi:hypothetical protein
MFNFFCSIQTNSPLEQFFQNKLNEKDNLDIINKKLLQFSIIQDTNIGNLKFKNNKYYLKFFPPIRNIKDLKNIIEDSTILMINNHSEITNSFANTYQIYILKGNFFFVISKNDFLKLLEIFEIKVHNKNTLNNNSDQIFVYKKEDLMKIIQSIIKFINEKIKHTEETENSILKTNTSTLSELNTGVLGKTENNSHNTSSDSIYDIIYKINNKKPPKEHPLSRNSKKILFKNSPKKFNIIETEEKDDNEFNQENPCQDISFKEVQLTEIQLENSDSNRNSVRKSSSLNSTSFFSHNDLVICSTNQFNINSIERNNQLNLKIFSNNHFKIDSTKNLKLKDEKISSNVSSIFYEKKPKIPHIIENQSIFIISNQTHPNQSKNEKVNETSFSFQNVFNKKKSENFTVNNLISFSIKNNSLPVFNEDLNTYKRYKNPKYNPPTIQNPFKVNLNTNQQIQKPNSFKNLKTSSFSINLQEKKKYSIFNLGYHIITVTLAISKLVDLLKKIKNKFNKNSFKNLKDKTKQDKQNQTN